jgi:tetratricopeptide (TPR) repeat protein
MTNIKREQRKYLEECRAEFEIAKEGDDFKITAMAQSYLAYAEIQSSKVKLGIKNFEEAIKIADSNEDIRLKVKILGVQILAFQIVGRLPDAFKAGQEIESIADVLGDLGMKCESLISQGQVQLDSGDPIHANEKFDEAYKIAKSLDEKHYLMDVLGAMGNYSLTIASTEKAYKYFLEAKELAVKLENKKSEIGYLGNMGTILEWEKDFAKADEFFLEVWTYFKDLGDKNSEVRALHHLVEVNRKLDRDEKVIEYCQRGIEISSEDKMTGLFFYKKSIFAYYKMNKLENAHTATKEAIKIARSLDNKEKELEFLLSLGESYMFYNMQSEALEIYEQALILTQRLQKFVDRAYLLGRIGVIFAEMGKIDEAINYHEQSILIAKDNNLTVLEAEQLTMLAIAYDEFDKKEQAIVYCNMALDLYKEKELEEDAEKVRQLLTTIEA